MQALRKVFPTSSYVKNRVLLARWCSTNQTQSTNNSQTRAEFPSIPSASTSFKDEGEEFRYLLRHSSLINLGDPVDKVVKGTIFQVVNDDLYIDFGWKFYCVCGRPSKGGERYIRGATVLLKLKSLEMSSVFLGAEKGLTLLEADAVIIQLLSSPAVEVF